MKDESIILKQSTNCLNEDRDIYSRNDKFKAISTGINLK